MKKFLMLQLLTLILGAAKSSAGVYSSKSDPSGQRLSVGSVSKQVCAIDSNGMHCYFIWDTNYPRFGKQGRFLEDSSVYAVSTVGDENICTISERGPECFKMLNYDSFNPNHNQFTAELEKQRIPQLKNVKQIHVGYGKSICAIDDNGMHCWDKKLGTAMNAPLLKDPKTISGSFYNYNYEKEKVVSEFCAIESNAVKCFLLYGGDFTHQIMTVPPLKNPKDVQYSRWNACATDDDGLHCWGWRDFDAKLKNPRSVSAKSTNYVCALDDDGAYCWYYGKPIDIPKLKNPSAIAVDGNIACAIDDDGLLCWELFSLNGTDKLRIQRFTEITNTLPITNIFHLDQLEAFLQLTERRSQSARAKYLNSLKEFTRLHLSGKEISESLSLSRYLMAKLISPAILSIDSKYGNEVAIPRYTKSIQSAEEELGFNNISKSPPTALNRKISMVSIRSAINVLKEFRSNDERALLANVLRALGQAITNPTDSNINAVISEIDAISPILTSSQKNSKSAFLVDSINLAKEWLGGK